MEMLEQERSSAGSKLRRMLQKLLQKRSLAEEAVAGDAW